MKTAAAGFPDQIQRLLILALFHSSGDGRPSPFPCTDLLFGRVPGAPVVGVPCHGVPPDGFDAVPAQENPGAEGFQG